MGWDSKWQLPDNHIVDGIPPETCGFVYKIQNNQTGRAYVGKKLLWFKGTKQVKGKKKRILVESDWRTYNGSNEELQRDIQHLGEDQFTFSILRFCKSKGEMSYWEIKYQLEADVLYHPEFWYNSYIGCRIHRKHLKLHTQTP